MQRQVSEKEEDEEAKYMSYKSQGSMWFQQLEIFLISELLTFQSNTENLDSHKI